jgi:hypothetical protein
VARLLVDHTGGRIDINRRGVHNYTALHHACMDTSSPQIVADLLARRADPCMASAHGASALAMARRAGSASCVRTLEDKLKLWQGWVDYYARKVLVPTWKTVWLVVHLDVRRNTNPSVKDMAICSRCLSQQSTPHFVTSFPCRQCQTEILVLPNLQLALYAPRRDGGRASSHMVLPDSPLPFVVETIPQRADFVRVAELDNPTYTNSVNALLQGNVSRAMQNTVGSARTHGLSIQILGADKQTVLSEHCIRVASAEDSVRLKDIFVDPRTSVAEKVGVTRPLQQATRTGHVSSPSSSSSGPEMAGGIPVVQATVVSAALPTAASHPGVCAKEQALRGAFDDDLSTTPAASSSSPGLAQESSAHKLSHDPTMSPLPEDPHGGGSCQVDSGATAPHEEVCVVCLEAPADSAIVPCGHMCGCHSCLVRIQTSGSALCPICRGPVTSTIRIYKS